MRHIRLFIYAVMLVANWPRIIKVTEGAHTGHCADLPAGRPAVTNSLLKDTGSLGALEGPYRSTILGRRHTRSDLPGPLLEAAAADLATRLAARSAEVTTHWLTPATPAATL